MVEASGCRCACQGGGEEFDLPPDDPSDNSSPGCCNAQVFTSVLLGILACVLMTGGVFLAFHRWDPMWLLVSGIGVILIFIGTILHCCSDNSAPARRPSGKGGCCGRPPAPDHPHIVTHNGSLTEQLLPLTNARSVSQLSLNMLPGYFPPVVTAYGIEQHSAVVQNINRLVQQQQQAAPNPQSPGNPAGKSFILLSLPGETPPANLQNLVATVYQLDGSIVPEPTTTDTNIDTPVPAATRMNNLAVKNAEVQTCHLLSNASVPNTSEPPVVSSSSSAESASSTTETSRTTVTTTSGTTQTEEHSSSEVIVDLMDCSVDIATSCDIVADSQATFANIPLSSSATLVDVSEPSTSSEILNSVLVDVPVSSTNFTEVSVSANLLDLATTNLVSVDVAQTVISGSSMLLDVSDLSTSNNQPSPSEQSQTAILPNTEIASEANNEIQPVAGTSRDTAIESNPENMPPPSYVALNNLELSSSSSNLSEIDAEIDDGEFLGRSSPPPSYEDVTHEGESSVGAFGLAYGTI